MRCGLKWYLYESSCESELGDEVVEVWDEDGVVTESTTLRHFLRSGLDSRDRSDSGVY